MPETMSIVSTSETDDSALGLSSSAGSEGEALVVDESNETPIIDAPIEDLISEARKLNLEFRLAGREEVLIEAEKEMDKLKIRVKDQIDALGGKSELLVNTSIEDLISEARKLNLEFRLAGREEVLVKVEKELNEIKFRVQNQVDALNRMSKPSVE